MTVYEVLDLLIAELKQLRADNRRLKLALNQLRADNRRLKLALDQRSAPTTAGSQPRTRRRTQPA